MATIINNLKPVQSIEQLNQLMAAGVTFIWYSRIFQCGFRITNIHESILENHVECVFETGTMATCQLNTIFFEKKISK